MINTINIGSYIYSKLSALEGVKTYPIVADNDAKFPFIVYRRTNLNSYNTKDGTYEEEVTIELSILTEKYKEGIDIANKVRKTLENADEGYDDYYVHECNLSYASEEYNHNAYIQKLNFNLSITN